MDMGDPCSIPEMSPMEVINRAIEGLGDKADRIVVVIQEASGDRLWQFSNARSSAELYGMLGLAQDIRNVE